MRQQTSHADHLWSLDVGPVKVDYGNAFTDLGVLAAVLSMLLLFRWAMKRI